MTGKLTGIGIAIWLMVNEYVATSHKHLKTRLKRGLEK